MLRAACTVEVAGSSEDSPGRQPVDGVAARLTAGGPEVESALGVLDREAGAFEGAAEVEAAGRVCLALDLDVTIVGQRGGHGPLDRRREHAAEVLANREELLDHRLVAGGERCAVAREVGPLRQGLDREQPVKAASADVGVKDRVRLALPGVFQVALVGHQQNTAFAGPVDHLLEVIDRQDLPVRVCRRVDVDQLGSDRTEADRRVTGDDLAPCVARADLIRRIGQFGDADRVAGAQTELGRKVGNEFLGPDRGQDRRWCQARDVEPALKPVDRCLAERFGSEDSRVAGRVGGRSEGCARDLRRRVDGGADREIDDATLMSDGDSLGSSEGVPGELGKPLRDLGHSWFWGGSAAMIG